MKFIVVSDLHLGSRKTPTESTIKGLKKCIFNLQALKDIDAVFFTGDFTDRELSYSSTEAMLITEFEAYMLRIADDTNTALRILEGTPYHEWGQVEHLIRIKNGLGLSTDVEYYTGFQIVTDPTLDLVIGYVCDEYSTSYVDAEKIVEEKLITLGVKPDLFFLHGFFGFQVPKLDIKTYDENKWKNWAYAIYIGHDHTNKSKGIITIPGSFNRTSHGEEGPKGYLVVEKVGNRYKTEFKINPYATKYITLEFNDTSDVDVYTYVTDILNLRRALNDDTYLTSGRLKLRLSPSHNLTNAIRDWRKAFPNIGLDVEIKKKQKIEVIEYNERLLRENNVINITADNISDLLTKDMSDRNPDCLTAGVIKEIEFLKSEM